MYSEHLTNVHPGWVVGGWLLSVSVASAAYLAFVGMGLASGFGDDAGWSLLAMALGFFSGGLFVGMRWTEAPILHGLMFGLMSIVVLLVLNLISPDAAASSLGDSVAMALGIVVIQILAAVAGGVAGRRTVLAASRSGEDAES